MTTSSARARLLLSSVAILVALVAFSSLTAAVAVGQGAPGGPKDGLAGQPEAKAAEMADYIQRIDFGAGSDPSGIFVGELQCAVPASCGGRESVHVRIVPSNFAATADWDKALHGGNGHVVAKVSNLDAVPYDRLNLGPNEVGYVWVGDSQGLGGTAALYTVKGGNVKRIFMFKGRTFCRNSAPQQPAVHINTPSKCSEMDSKAMGAAQQASIEPFTAIASYLVKRVSRMLSPPPAESGLWISCSLGCCEAQF